MRRSQPFVLAPGEDPCPGLPVERGPDGKGVGDWVPEMKHMLLGKWLSATSRFWAKWPERIFIDPFCGPGRIQVRGENSTRDGGSVVAFRESLRANAPFTRMLIGDLKPERVNANAARLKALGATVQTFPGPAQETIKQIVQAAPKKTLALAYLDPYNLEFLSFDIIETLATLRVDFAVHFSLMDMTRNIEMELDDDRARFDGAAPGWRKVIDVAKMSKAEARQAFFAHWRGLVEKLGFGFSEEMPLVRGTGNAPLYRLVFFSRNKDAARIWSDVARTTDPNLRLPF